MSHKREPIDRTCPEINKYIKSINYCIHSDRNLKSMEHSDLIDICKEMRDELENCIQYLEDLRKSNEILRQWGVDEAEEVDSLNKHLNSIEQ